MLCHSYFLIPEVSSTLSIKRCSRKILFSLIERVVSEVVLWILFLVLYSIFS